MTQMARSQSATGSNGCRFHPMGLYTLSYDYKYSQMYFNMNFV